MKTLSKVLSMLIVVVMCLSLFGASAYATVDVPDVYAGSFGTNEGNQAPDVIDVPDMSNAEPEVFDGDVEIPTTDSDVPNTVTVPGNENEDEFKITPYTTGETVIWTVDGKDYTSLQEAAGVAAKSSSRTVSLRQDSGSFFFTENATIGGNITINFGDEKIAITDGGITINNGTVTFTATENGGISHGSIIANTLNSGKLVINGGEYGDAFFGGTKNAIIKSGMFTSDPKDFADGSVTMDSNGLYVVGAADENYIAFIGDKGYTTIKGAIDDAVSGQTVVIKSSKIQNLTESSEVVIEGKNLTIAADNETVNFAGGLKISGKNVTIRGYQISGEVTVSGGAVLNLNTQKAGTVYVRTNASLNVNGGNVENVVVNDATVSMSSGTIESLVAKGSSKLYISGGYVNAFATQDVTGYNNTVSGGEWTITNSDAVLYLKSSLQQGLEATEKNNNLYVVGKGSGSTNPGGTTTPSTGSYSISTNSYVRYSGNSVYVTRGTNAPVITDIWYSSDESTIVGASYYGKLDFTTYGNTSYIDTSDLDALRAGTWYIFAAYNTTSGTQATKAGWIRISNSGTSIPDYDGTLQVGTRYENDWYQGDDPLQFYVSPNPDRTNGANMKVSIDGRELGNLDYYDYLNGYFYIGTAKLASLSSGTHWLTVENTKTGETDSCTFYVGPTLRARDTNKHVTGSSKDLKFVCSEPITRVWVGDKELDNYDSYDYYTLSRDGKTLTLTARFLNNRTAGSTYNLTVETNTGERVSTTFQILTTAQASSSPKTGDNSNLALWVSALVMSGAAAAVILPKMKKKEIEG